MRQKRKQHLQHTIDMGYASHHQGRLLTRKYRIRVMHRILEDLCNICRLPKQWSSLTTRHIDHLVTHWRQQKLQPATIMKWLSVLRHFNRQLQLPWNIPTNQHYGLQVSTSASILPDFQFDDVHGHLLHPVVKCVFGFECLFGLTRQEVLPLQPALHGAMKNRIHITRDIALHGKERYVPILTEDQQKLLQAWSTLLVNPYTSLSEQWPIHLLQPLYRTCLHNVGLKGHIRYRFYYLRRRRQQLTQQPFKQQLHILKQETGLSFSHIRSLIHE